MLAFQTVDSHTLELLTSLMQQPVLYQTRLVGGTALALQYAHRNSVDIDLFGTVEADREEIKTVLQSIGQLDVVSEKENIKCYYIDNIKVDIVNYRYPWIDNVIMSHGLRLASDKDIAAMKINAIEGRGSKKDFIDIYFLLQHYSLKEILSFYKQKYPEHSEFRALMSLTYFDDADLQPLPKMFKQIEWKNLKGYISNQVRAY